MRVFIAIELPDEIKREIAAVQETLKKNGLSANWTRSDGIHLTLKFLGEVPEAEIQNIMTALSVLGGIGAFQIQPAGAGAFPNIRSPRVIWLGMAGNIEQLALVQQTVEECMQKLGFEQEDREFSPHLTLARIKFPRRGDDWQHAVNSIKNAALSAFEVDHVSLMKSELHPKGAVYTELGRIRLKEKQKNPL